MSYNNISAAVTATQKTGIKSNIDTVKAALIFLVSLTPAERKRFRKMGFIRTAYVQEVLTVANANPTALSVSFNLAEFNKDYALLRDLVEIMSWLKPLYEGIDDTIFALGMESIKQSDEAYAHLKIEAIKNSNISLTMAVKRISDQLKRKPKKAATETPDLTANPNAIT